MRLVADDFYEDAVGQGGVAEDVDDSIFGECSEHGVGFGVRIGWSVGLRGVGGGLEGRRGGSCWSVGALHSAVHGLVGEAVGVLVFVAEGVRDLEGLEF